MKKRSTPLHLALATAACLAASSAFAQTITIDGNPGDWPAVLANASYPKSFSHDLYNSASDDVFTGGATASSNIASWLWGTGTMPNAKSDIENSAVVIVGNKLNFFIDRYAGNGDVTLDIWLLPVT